MDGPVIGYVRICDDPLVQPQRSVHPPFCWGMGGGGGWASYKIFRKGSLAGSLFLKGGSGKQGVNLFRMGGLQFLH